MLGRAPLSASLPKRLHQGQQRRTVRVRPRSVATGSQGHARIPRAFCHFVYHPYRLTAKIWVCTASDLLSSHGLGRIFTYFICSSVTLRVFNSFAEAHNRRQCVRAQSSAGEVVNQAARHVPDIIVSRSRLQRVHTGLHKYYHYSLQTVSANRAITAWCS